VNIEVAALIAHMDVSKQLVFGRIRKFRDSLYQNGVKLMKRVSVSKEYGLSVASYIKKWMDRDNYKPVRCLSFLFTLISREDGSQHHHLTWMESSLTGVKSEH
jgi:hypothetical protein